MREKKEVLAEEEEEATEDEGSPDTEAEVTGENQQETPIPPTQQPTYT